MSLTLKPSKSSAPRLPDEWMAKLFQKLVARYGTLFMDRYQGVPKDVLMQEWAEELAGYSGEEIARGLAGCRDLKFPPTLPEFMSLCRPPIDPHTAFVQAVNNLRLREQGEDPEWEHPAIFWAAMDVTHFDMRSQPYTALRSRWERALSTRLAQGRWDAIPPTPKQLPAPPFKPNHAAMQAIKALADRMRINSPKESE